MAGYYKERYGRRLQKVVVDAGFTCPNRDGSKGRGGCTFCDNRAFHPGYSTPGKPIGVQIDEGIEFHGRRYRNAQEFLAYFQPYSNTYAPLPRLRELYEEALSHPKVSGIVIGTRPDCVDTPLLDYLAELSRRAVVMVEYGVESCRNETLAHINRGHTWEDAIWAVTETARRGIPVCGHFILGLPGETPQLILESAEAINGLPLTGVKFHQLQLIKGTAMEEEARLFPERFTTWPLQQYIDFMVDLVERLRPDLYIERIAGEVPPRFVQATPWGLIRNTELLRMFERRLEERDTHQGAKLGR